MFTVTVALSWSSSAETPLLGVESGSAWSEAETWALLAIVVPAVPMSTVAVRVRVALAVAEREPTVQIPVVPVSAG